MTIEERVIAACQKAKTLKKPNFAALSREYCVPVQRLRARAKGRQSKNDRPAPHRRLDDAQEAALFAWINRLDNLGVPPTSGRIEASANAMIRRLDPLAPSLNKNWVYHFIEKATIQHSFFWIKQKPMGRDRYSSLDIGIIQAFFDRIEPLIAAIPASHIYNFDETGFLLGQGRPQNVLTKYSERRSIASEERGSLFTGIECISADSWLMPAYFVAKGKFHLERWYINNNNLPHNSRIAMSSSGYSNDEIAID
ncbi:hypothetical protein N7481_001671 [Penicillium waksmanii]|uniref:uncharacterized protein n=1 Tax=Penicillium waksmanii TaxID=69791 RepID=UPI0025467834|nr:uncharacterized protein N7481_001671 [Penicillium waksmanii]KAJ5994694.1 hypothetical protein N7481_001671 [Penicillium waksmanii]